MKEIGIFLMESKPNTAKVSSQYLALRMEIWVHRNMRVPGKKIKCVGMVHIITPMVQYTKDNGNKINNTEEANINFPMEHVMMEIGKII